MPPTVDSPTTIRDEWFDAELGGDGPIDLALLRRWPTYARLAEAFGTDRERARQSVCLAVDEVVPVRDGAPDAARRGEIVDYLLNEQPFQQRMKTRSALDHSAGDRAWANEALIRLASALETTLPAIPDPVIVPVRRRARLAEPPNLSLSGAHIDGWDTIPRRPVRARRGMVALLCAAMVAAAALAIVFLTRSTADRQVSVLAPAGGSRSGSAPTVRGGRPRAGSGSTLQRLTLASTGAQPDARGVAAVVSQNGTLLLLVQGYGFTPSHHDFYAVWLYNTEANAELLGLISPGVGTAGTFSSGTTLPADAIRFHTLVVTHETSPAPSRPGEEILSSPLTVR